MIICGDARAELAKIEAGSIAMVVTSPPYWGLRDYGVAEQLGLEESPDQYVANMVSLFREVRRSLRDSGTLWLNLGDSYTSGGRRSRDHDAKLSARHMAYRAATPSGLKPKDLVGIPWRVAFALQADGWHLRQDIIWHKPNAMPESVRDRCTKAHEYIFLLSKGPRYFFDHEAIKEPAICGAKGSQFHIGKTGDHQLGRSQKVRPSKPNGSFIAKGEPLPGQLPFRAVVEMRNKRSVWTVSTKPFKGSHFATFPRDLIEPCILAGSAPGDTVLDPFFGAGTTGLVAKQHGRKFIGIEINPKYCEMAACRIDAANDNERGGA